MGLFILAPSIKIRAETGHEVGREFGAVWPASSILALDHGGPASNRAIVGRERPVFMAALSPPTERGLTWSAAPAVPPLLARPALPGVLPHALNLPLLDNPLVRAREAEMEAQAEARKGELLREALQHRRGSRSPGHLLDRRSAASQPGLLPATLLSQERMSTRWSDPLERFAFGPEYIMPFANGRVTSLFNQGRRHPAIDLAGALGSPVLATTSRQTVTFAGWRGGYGNAVITRDAFGWTHLYGHLKSITARIGQVLIQGDKLGHLGSTGHSTGPHVHYEVKNSRGAHVNPVTLLFPGRGVSKGYAWLDVRQEQRPAPRVASR